MPSLDELELALARSLGYELLGRLVREGPTDENLRRSSEVPELAEDWPEDPDLRDAAFYEVLHQEVFPSESVFLERDGVAGGEVARAVSDFYARAGFRPPSLQEAPDHLGHELELMAFLSAAEHDALRDRLPDQVTRLRALMRSFLDTHLLRWLPVFRLSLSRFARFGRWAELIHETVVDHRDALGGPVELADSDADEVWTLDRPETSLADIVENLSVAARSGLVLTRRDVVELARGLGIPRGFGGRRLMLTNAWRSAVDHDRVAELVETIKERARVDHTALTERRGMEPEVVRPHYDPWLVRLEETCNALDRVRDAVRNP